MSKEQVKDLTKEQSELDQYYSNLIIEILGLYQSKNFEKALAIIEEELNQPYIPGDILTQLLELRNDIEKIVSNDRFEQKFSDMNKLEIWNNIYNEDDSTFDISFFNLLLEKFQNELDEVDLSIIQKIFLNKNISNLDKWTIIHTLNELGISHEFKLYNDHFKKVISFSIEKYNNEPKEQLKEIMKSLENEFIQDPSKFQIAIDLLMVIHIKFIPDCIEFSNHDIIITLKNIVNSFFGEEAIEENQISEMLSEFIKMEDDE
ncbi:MAG: DUF3196 family protein [Mycoplasma sp.]